MPIKPDDPQPGYYKRKMVKNGPWAPCKLEYVAPRDSAGRAMDRSHVLTGHVGPINIKSKTDALKYWPLHPITQDEYTALIDTNLNPFEPIDLDQMPPLF